MTLHNDNPIANTFPLTYACWGRCLSSILYLPNSLLNELWERYINSRYSEEWRHYHTLTHLEEMLNYLREYEANTPASHHLSNNNNNNNNNNNKEIKGKEGVRRLIVELSLLFHDAVYDPRRNDNEERSAEWFQTFWNECYHLASQSNIDNKEINNNNNNLLNTIWCNLDVAEHVEKTVVEFILATKHHMSVQPEYLHHISNNNNTRGKVLEENQTTIEIFSPPPPDLHLFLDLDLAILGSNITSYQKYAADIRREYSWYSDKDFCHGRVTFLHGFLKHSQWYKTKFFCDTLEEVARANVEAEITTLETQLKELL